MVSGEEVVARVSSTKEDQSGNIISYVLDSPQVLSVQNVQGRVGLAFIPWTLSNPDISSITVPATSVLVTFSPADMVEKQYLQETSKIALA